MTLVQEDHVRVDISPTSSTPSYHLILNNGHRIVDVVKGGIWLNDEGKWQFRLLKQGMRSRDCIYGRPDIFGRAVRIGRLGDTSLLRESALDMDYRYAKNISTELTFGGKMQGGGGKSNSDTLNGWLSKSVG